MQYCNHGHPSNTCPYRHPENDIMRLLDKKRTTKGNCDIHHALHCDNNWCVLKEMIRSEHHELSELPLLRRLIVKWHYGEIECTRRWESGTEVIQQSWIIVQHEGVEYFKRWGVLSRP